MSWHATLRLRYSLRENQTVVQHRHEGPLRVLKSLYPEDRRICHNVLIHPPGGIVGGDRLDIAVEVESGAHGLISTPGATRFYRSEDLLGVQDVRLQLAEYARLEWLPLETLVHPGAKAENRLTFQLARGASLIGWDLVGLGLPHAGQPFDQGSLVQQLEWPGVWLDKARIDAIDAGLLNSPLGLAGHRCMATMFFATPDALTRAQCEAALELTRQIIQIHALDQVAGVTALNHRLLVLRALAPVTEPISMLLRQVWGAWRKHFWQAATTPPRIWSV